MPLIEESNHLIRKILNKLGMGNIDTGDLLLLLILFLLFSEGGEKDEELGGGRPYPRRIEGTRHRDHRHAAGREVEAHLTGGTK